MIYMREIQDIVTALEQQHQIKPIAIELVDPTVAMIYKESSRAQVIRACCWSTDRVSGATNTV